MNMGRDRGEGGFLFFIFFHRRSRYYNTSYYKRRAIAEKRSSSLLLGWSEMVRVLLVNPLVKIRNGRMLCTLFLDKKNSIGHRPSLYYMYVYIYFCVWLPYSSPYWGTYLLLLQNVMSGHLHGCWCLVEIYLRVDSLLRRIYRCYSYSIPGGSHVYCIIYGTTCWNLSYNRNECLFNWNKAYNLKKLSHPILHKNEFINNNKWLFTIIRKSRSKKFKI